MKATLALLVSILVAVLCWGGYGPLVQLGGKAMGGGSLRPFICVGLAYFLIAVLVPAIILNLTGERGRWTSSGVFWSLIAGAAGAIGALGIILAVGKFHGNPLYVMPLVFGGAPVVNTFLTMFLARSYRQAGPVFFAGLILVIAGAVVVLMFRPAHHAPAAATAAVGSEALVLKDWLKVFLFTAMTAVAWGVYGPTLHKGQVAMQGSRLRPFICVGLAYFLIAVLVPAVLLMGPLSEPGGFTFKGVVWSLAGGAAGAIGAMGIIMAFNFGGRPIYVMPLVFGGAPVVNTFISLWQMDSVGPVNPVFYAGLILVIAGAVTVLLFAPKAPPHAAAPAHAPKSKQAVKSWDNCAVTPDEAMRRIDSLLSHVWMVRAFLKHSDEAVEDEELQEIHRALYDYHLAVGAAWRDQDSAAYLKLARKKYSRLHDAAEDFKRIQPEVSSHTNFQMAAASLSGAVAQIGEILAQQKREAPKPRGDSEEE